MTLPFFRTKRPQMNSSAIREIPQKKESLQALWRLVQTMLVNLEFEDVADRVVNNILDELGYLQLGYRIIVLALVNKSSGFLERIAISETAEAKEALKLSPVPFREIRIPLSETNNLSIRALQDKVSYQTRNWYDILRPVYNSDQAAIIQKGVGIKASMVFPLIFRNESIGILIFSMNKDYDEVTEEENDLLRGFVDLVGLTVQNSKLYTSLRATSIQLQTANQRLKELDQLKDDFVSITSHELRTPMTVIRSYAWMVLNKSDIELSEKMKKSLVRILISAERLINLVNDLLNVSRIEAQRIEINPQPLNLISLVKDIIDEIYYSKSTEKNIQFIILEQKLPEVFADPDKLRQVLLNLVGNSVKFTPPGGKITFSFFTDGQVVETSVKDSGVGISKEDLGRLFQKFGRLDTSYISISSSGGTGLGLYISKKLIELMHGKIWAESEGVGKGTTFTFSLPIASREVLQHADQFKIKPKGEVKGLEPVAI